VKSQLGLGEHVQLIERARYRVNASGNTERNGPGKEGWNQSNQLRGTGVGVFV